MFVIAEDDGPRELQETTRLRDRKRDRDRDRDWDRDRKKTEIEIGIAAGVRGGEGR